MTVRVRRSLRAMVARLTWTMAAMCSVTAMAAVAVVCVGGFALAWPAAAASAGVRQSFPRGTGIDAGSSTFALAAYSSKFITAPFSARIFPNAGRTAPVRSVCPQGSR